MPPSRRIVIYGNSISLAGIAVNCSNRPGLEIVSIDADDPQAAQRLQGAAPDVVIFDVTAHPDSALALFRALPHIICIAMDPASDQVLLLSGQRAPVLSTADLMKLISYRKRGSAGSQIKNA